MVARPAGQRGKASPAAQAVKPTDIRVRSVQLYFLPIQARMPLKFGHQILSHMTCARVRVVVSDRAGRTAEGWGETPLAVEWGWPSLLDYESRHQAMRQFCQRVAAAWASTDALGHPLELGQDFLDEVLPGILAEQNENSSQNHSIHVGRPSGPELSTGSGTGSKNLSQNHPSHVERPGKTELPAGSGTGPKTSGLPEPMPRLAALICASTVDLAVHDAYGMLHGRPTYATYNAQFMNRDLKHYFRADERSGVRFEGRFPDEFLTLPRPERLPAWHLVGGLDPLEPADIREPAPHDEHPVALSDWIKRDGLTCLKIKLRGNDATWDYDRLVRVGALGKRLGSPWLSADFNCTVTDPAYVNTILDQLLAEQPKVFQMLLYVEQPFPYDLEANPIDVRSVSARKPLFMDESAHDWKIVRRGRDLGWSGVALKTCKPQTGALLSLCWARAHGMPLMVQDLANPMLALVSHSQLAAHAGTIMGVESNSSQFFPSASLPEAEVHPGLYRRHAGQIDLGTLGPTGFGYRVSQIQRALPEPAGAFGT